MPALTPFQLLSLAVTVGATGVSVAQSRISQSEERRAQRLRQRQASVENQRSIRQAIAASRQQQASQIAQAGEIGFESSAIQGGLGAATTQVAANVGFARQTDAFNRGINSRLQASSRAAGRASTFQAVAGLPTQFGFDPSKLKFKVA